nr:hypothetical protein [uncultured Flavobacterium sp.]
MKIRFNLYILFVLLISFGINAQDRVAKNGRIIAKYYELNDIAIQNVSAKKTVYSEKGGYFKLPITVNDTIMFSSENYKPINIIITPEDLKSRFLYVSLEPNENTLEEMVIDGSISKNIYSNAKARKVGMYKRLHTATSGGPISQLVNILSGRTKLIKKIIEMEKQSDLAEQLISSMSEDYFTQDLKIPKENIGNFGFYLIDDIDITEAVKRRNTYQLEFLLPIKAEMYLESIKDNKQ